MELGRVNLVELRDKYALAPDSALYITVLIEFMCTHFIRLD
jgi:hypothetical protein